MDFLDWLAGFVCGEGCFCLKGYKKQDWRRYKPPLASSRGPRKKGAGSCLRYRPCFEVNQRADNAGIVEEIRERLGFGLIAYRKGQKSPGRNGEAQVLLTVQRAEDCLKLVAIFEAHPLRGKKQEVFDLWKVAVSHVAENGGTNQYDCHINWNYLAEIRNEMDKIIEYGTRDGTDAAVVVV